MRTKQSVALLVYGADRLSVRDRRPNQPIHLLHSLDLSFDNSHSIFTIAPAAATATVSTRYNTVVLAAFAILGLRSTESQELSGRDRTEDQALERLHSILRHPAGPGGAGRHDAYLSLIGFGNDKSLPLLLDRLRLDYGESEPVVPAGVKLGFVCAQIHLVDAIRYITNTDQGMFYPRWAKWWELNRGYSRL